MLLPLVSKELLATIKSRSHPFSYVQKIRLTHCLDVDVCLRYGKTTLE